MTACLIHRVNVRKVKGICCLRSAFQGLQYRRKEFYECPYLISSPLILPVLKLTRNGAEHPSTEFRERLAVAYKLTPGELARKYKNGTPVFTNRVAWAIVHLELAEVLSLVTKGTYQVTERGTSLLKEKPPKITIKMLDKMYGVPG